jgi:hypothetical protein
LRFYRVQKHIKIFFTETPEEGTPGGALRAITLAVAKPEATGEQQKLREN